MGRFVGLAVGSSAEILMMDNVVRNMVGSRVGSTIGCSVGLTGETVGAWSATVGSILAADPDKEVGVFDVEEGLFPGVCFSSPIIFDVKDCDGEEDGSEAANAGLVEAVPASPVGIP